MAIAKMCDRCGCVTNLFSAVSVKIEKHMCGIEMLDLCPECERKFRDFMKDGKKEKTNESRR